MQQFTLQRATYLLLFIALSVVILIYGREFLVPIAFGGILSMLFVPISQRIERLGLHRGIAALICVLLLLGLLYGIYALVSWQVNQLTQQVGNVQQQFLQLWSDFQQNIQARFGISPNRQEEMLRQQGAPSGQQVATVAAGFFGSVSEVIVDFLIVLVYLFLFLTFRAHFKKFILKLVPAAEEPKASLIIDESSRVTRQYLVGLGLMILSLWVMYSIGFSIVGIQSPVLFAIICGTLEIIPYIGNLTGTALTATMALVQGGGLSMVIGVLITYFTIQTIQSYLLEPLVVGREVNINPVATIVVLLAGEMVWGIAGLMLALPLLAILKVVCDHIEPLKPFGFLIGGTGEKKDGKGIGDKIKNLFNRDKK